jgi:hypothetical protein
VAGGSVATDGGVSSALDDGGAPGDAPEEPQPMLQRKTAAQGDPLVLTCVSVAAARAPGPARRVEV